jgi:hypothetical protein
VPFHPRFTVGKFEDMIARRGKLLLWERARMCPCWNMASRSAQEGCLLCSGFGQVYSTQGHFTGTVLGMASSKQYAKFGEWLAGDCVLTYPAAYLLGDRDRITVTTDVYRETDVLQRGTRDSLPEPNLLSILECQDQTGRFYTQGDDFDLAGKQIVWRPNRGPANLVTYSVLYTARPAYVVYLQLPQHRALSGGREMPRKVALRRWLDFTRDA